MPLSRRWPAGASRKTPPSGYIGKWKRLAAAICLQVEPEIFLGQPYEPAVGFREGGGVGATLQLHQQRVYVARVVF